ncbi:MAG TPA: hypothetical protein VIV54_19910 [Burkholderiales bacterium]
MNDRWYFTWRGRETLPEVKAAMARGDAVEIILPPDTHHALYMHIYPDGRSCDSAAIDASNGAELLHSIATVAGLQDLAELEQAVRISGYRTAITSPSPNLELVPPTASRALRHPASRAPRSP